MPLETRQITRDDIMPMEAYGPIRQAKRQELRPMKKARQVSVGPFATFYFESYDTMWHQIHEMLWIEKGGEAQIPDELAAYNPLIPQGRELVATLMFEIEDPVRRETMLKRLGGVDETVFLQVGDEKIGARIDEDDVERTTPDGKTSSVHFLRFPFTDAQVARFKDPSVQVLLGMDHENYAHLSILSPTVRAELGKDFA